MREACIGLRLTLCWVICVAAVGEETQEQHCDWSSQSQTGRVVYSDFRLGDDGWKTTGPEPVLQDESLVVAAPDGIAWHFIAPRHFLRSTSLHSAKLSFYLQSSFVSSSQQAQHHNCTTVDSYRVVVSHVSGNNARSLGVRMARAQARSGQFEVTFDASMPWENVSTGALCPAADIRDFMSTATTLLIGCGCTTPSLPSSKSAPLSPATPRPWITTRLSRPALRAHASPGNSVLEERRQLSSERFEQKEDRNAESKSKAARDHHQCDTLFREQAWAEADACYQEWGRREARSGSEGPGTCWAVVRSVRVSLMLRKPATNDTLKVLRSVLDDAKGAAAGDGVWQLCLGWASRTLGDVLFRDQKYAAAARAYEEAIQIGLNSSIMLAVCHSDVAAALHLSGAPSDTISQHYQRSTELLPEMRVFHVLGALGTMTYKGDARIVIEDQLHALAKQPTSPQRTEWGIQISDLELRSPQCRQRGAASVAFFCRLRGQTPGTADQVWGPSSVKKGVGGSEEAAIYLSRELAKKGYCVRVYGNAMVEEWGADRFGVVWLPFFAYRLQQPSDVFVVWRNWDAVWMAPNARKRFLWVHDPLSLASDQDYYTAEYLAALNGIFVLSSHSASQFPPQAQSKLILTSNGLPPHLIRDGANHHSQLLYSSWPSSGLEQILLQWPKIRAGAPNAELHVYYGFDMWWATPMYKNEPWFIEWRAKMEAMLRQDGVLYKGGVGHAEMAAAYAETGFYLYPTDTQETAPINLIKAQANGCVPITSRYPKSAIPETTAHFDLGPEPRHGTVIKDDPAWMAEWTEAVVNAVNTPPEELYESPLHSCLSSFPVVVFATAGGQQLVLTPAVGPDASTDSA